jgi:predicted nucleic acid-binding protein
MILVDTSIWIDHLRTNDSILIELLYSGRVYIHHLVIGEIACGNLKNRKEIISLLKDLPKIAQAKDEEVLSFIEQNELMGKGIGYIDSHLLASVVLQGDTLLWTKDVRLKKLAERMSLSLK